MYQPIALARLRHQPGVQIEPPARAWHGPSASA
jgi:hypothetical protein